eukprot:gb/GECG01008377.1/.p1 GENE.gb/GECG01008377.1/~~gb/GECG01008377.1/.p1  ORF type:complete len:101 (+),score=12.13 gb/GECG01008377.1/:1-303(+)
MRCNFIGFPNVIFVVRFLMMNPDNQATWMKEFQYAVEKIPIEKLIIGLETVKSDGSPYSSKVLEERFQQLETAGIRGIGLWRSPIPDVFFPFLKKYKGIT